MEKEKIEIDLEVYKLIEGARESFSETQSDILRRILELRRPDTGGGRISTKPVQDDAAVKGLYVKGVTIPDGTRLRKTLKGVLHEAQLTDGAIEYKGERYYTPSKAGVAASKTNVNGWKFWDYFDERTRRWSPLDNLRNGRG